MSTGSIGYTSGALYKRHAGIGYAPGSHYKKFGNLGLPQRRNMSAMNRAAADGAAAAAQAAGPKIFEAKTVESFGLSELAAQQVLARAKAMMNAIAQNGENVSAAASGSGSSVDASV